MKGQKKVATMAETYRYTLAKPARLIYSSVTQKSAPRGVQGAVPKYSGNFGIEQEDFDAIVKLEVQAIKSELGSFSGNPGEYYLACTSGDAAAKRAIAKAELDARGKTPDEAFKIKDKAEKRAASYREFAGILVASSQFDVELAKLENGKIVDIPDEQHAKAQAGKDNFYPGAYVVPAVAFKGFARKTMDAKDGVTAYLQNCLFVRKGERLGGSGPANQEVFGSYAGYSNEDPTAMAPNDDPYDADLNDDTAF
tara:strand:+ start:258 stop:1016 length:759 start_codon:yes stop_codon:yes gene_type:complete